MFLKIRETWLGDIVQIVEIVRRSQDKQERKVAIHAIAGSRLFNDSSWKASYSIHYLAFAYVFELGQVSMLFLTWCEPHSALSLAMPRPTKKPMKIKDRHFTLAR
jgi:hypothetical protein